MAKDEDVEEVEEESSPGISGRGPQPPRISITLPNRIRKRVRIAAARADMEVPDWCRTVLVRAARLTVERLDEGR